MSDNDYYQLLGVEKSASEDQIKKAYRKLAMKYHPDHTSGDKQAEEKFKKISEAYAVLSDSEKRSQYDQYGSAGFQQRYSQEDIFRGFDFGDIFKEFGFGGGFAKGRGGGMRFSFGGDSPFGAGRQPRTKGADLVYELPISLKEAALGSNKPVAFQHKGRSEQVNVQIPKGIANGKRLRLTGKGEPSPYGGQPGDLYIKINVLDDPVFKVEDKSLVIHHEIKLTQALLGTSISVPTLDDRTLSLKVPPGTRHKTRLRLPGHGLPQMNTSTVGDLFVCIHVAMPKDLTPEQEQIVAQLAQTGL
jgi:curved DNA-binding protein